ncbi:MAG TPA: hypothetical protein VGP47_01290 [Parachlamydiaceae bacterium]|nr:hypothetical protein [Parachlamydiaceae bacterium]
MNVGTANPSRRSTIVNQDPISNAVCNTASYAFNVAKATTCGIIAGATKNFFVTSSSGFNRGMGHIYANPHVLINPNYIVPAVVCQAISPLTKAVANVAARNLSTHIDSDFGQLVHCVVNVSLKVLLSMAIWEGIQPGDVIYYGIAAPYLTEKVVREMGSMLIS